MPDAVRAPGHPGARANPSTMSRDSTVRPVTAATPLARKRAPRPGVGMARTAPYEAVLEVEVIGFEPTAPSLRIKAS